MGKKIFGCKDMKNEVIKLLEDERDVQLKAAQRHRQMVEKAVRRNDHKMAHNHAEQWMEADHDALKLKYTIAIIKKKLVCGPSHGGGS